MRVEYDRDLDAMYIMLKEGRYAFSEEIDENALLDLDPEGRILAIEIVMSQNFSERNCSRRLSGPRGCQNS